MIDLELDDYLFQSSTMKFAIRSDDPKADDFIEDAMVVFEGQQFFITDVIGDHTADGKALKRIEAESWWMRLADRKKPGNFGLHDVTAAAGIETILEGMSVTLDNVPTDETEYTLDTMDSTVLEIIWMWAKITGNEVDFHKTERKITFLPQVGVDRGMSFRWGKNLTSIKRVSQPPKVTRLWAYGRDGLSVQAFTSGQQFIEDFSYYTAQGLTEEEARGSYTKDEIYSDDSFVEDTGLYNFALTRLTQLAQPTVTYSCTAVDLSEMLGVNDTRYRPGDTVWVYDEILGLDLQARVSRRVHYPNEPEKDKVELAFNGIAIPDPNANTARNDTTKSWELFESRNMATERNVRHIQSILNKLILRHIENSEWIVSYKVQGVAVGSGTLTLRIYDALSGLDLWPVQTVTLVNGARYDFEMSFGQKDIPAGTTQVTVSAISSDVSCGLDIPETQTALWVLARGTTRTTLSFPNSVTYAPGYYYFQVPEYVYELQVECVGGAASDQYGGTAGRVTAKIAVTPLECFDCWVGDRGASHSHSSPINNASSFPNGGGGDFPGSSPGGGGSGGGSTSIVRSTSNKTPIIGSGTPNLDTPAKLAALLGTFADSLLVAPAGGGSGDGQIVTYGLYGGDGKFLQGEDGMTVRRGYGASQYAGGAADPAGTAGSLGQGGAAGTSTSSFNFGGGGGGGGWFGGGGAGTSIGGGYGGAGGGGGGGSGWAGDVYDLEIEDGANSGSGASSANTTGRGSMTISWPDPDESLAPYTGGGEE